MVFAYKVGDHDLEVFGRPPGKSMRLCWERGEVSRKIRPVNSLNYHKTTYASARASSFLMTEFNDSVGSTNQRHLDLGFRISQIAIC